MSSNIEDECRLSYYKVIGTINEKHKVYYVQNIENNKIYVKKTLSVYNKNVYDYIKEIGNTFYPKIYECIEKENHLIVIEEYINGNTLDEILKKRGQLTEKETADIVIRLCRALYVLHSHEPVFIHRDIKPSNICITNDGSLKIIDINSAKEFHENSSEDTILFGTKNYAAPEQFGFGQSDERTDIYAVGVLINVCLTGRFPKEMLCTGRFRKIVEKCINIEPQKRYSDVTSLMNEVMTVMSIKQGNVPQKTSGYLQKIFGKTFADSRFNIFGIKPDYKYLPGFRTLEWSKMFIAAAGYAFIIYLSVSIQMTEKDGSQAPGYESFCARIAFFIIQMMTVFLACDYLGIRKRLPFQNSSNMLLKAISVAAAWFVAATIIIILMVIVIMIIQGVIGI